MKVKYQPVIIAVTVAAMVLIGSALVLGVSSADLPTAQADTLQQDAPASRTITVVGEGKVSAPPDMAVVNIGVQVNDPDVQEATQKANDQMDSLIAALKEADVVESDIETSYYNLYVDRPYGPQGPTGEATYQVSNNLQVTIRDLDNLSGILGAAIDAGANNISSINFQISDPSKLRSEARQRAVDNAQTRAQELAELNDVAVGQVVRISEIIDQGAYFVSEQAAAAEGLGGGGPTISPGDVDVTVQLQITYGIVQ